MTNIIQDISQLTTIPLASLQKLSTLSEECICHAVLEDITGKEEISVVDIGIGKLMIKQEDNTVKYKFIPSTHFEEQLVKTILTKTSPLTVEVEQVLVTRILNTYKDLL